MGTTTTPPPNPVSAPRKPARKEPSATRPLNSRTFMLIARLCPRKPLDTPRLRAERLRIVNADRVSRGRIASWRLRLSRLRHFPTAAWWILRRERATLESGRGTQVVRERSAKPLCVGSIPTRASKILNDEKPSDQEGFFIAANSARRVP